MSKKLFELAAEIVHAQASASTMSPEDIELVLARTFNTLYKMQRAEEEGTSLIVSESHSEAFNEQEASKPTDPLLSIREDKIICMECGGEFRQLTANHLNTHQLTPREYKKKWGFPLRQSLAAKVLTRSRSRAAKKRGLPVELQKYQEEQRMKKAEGVPSDDANVSQSVSKS